LADFTFVTAETKQSLVHNSAVGSKKHMQERFLNHKNSKEKLQILYIDRT